MKRDTRIATEQVVSGEWVTFPGGELEGRRPRVLCSSCRERLRQAAAGDTVAERPRALCFQCYRAELSRERALKAAGELDTASVERFQSQLPFEPVNRPRLETLRIERTAARVAAGQGAARFADKRRHAQIAARQALQRVATGLVQRHSSGPDREGVMAAAVHAAELQLPESWLEFVVSRSR
ncbi:MAG: hypothetical protein EXQ59_00990 [Acidobacteria bacterium]|nr:hypothetical protein [Acidobacteriota bacterium]